jgi:hypothetical protein
MVEWADEPEVENLPSMGRKLLPGRSPSRGLMPSGSMMARENDVLVHKKVEKLMTHQPWEGGANAGSRASGQGKGRLGQGRGGQRNRLMAVWH